ncbi:hypothetical protein ACFQX7_27170 [Luedemannella flava]
MTGRLPTSPHGPPIQPPTAAGLYEVGVIGHGPHGRNLAEQVADVVLTWNDSYRDKSVRFSIPDSDATHDPASGRFVLERPHHPIAVVWE